MDVRFHQNKESSAYIVTEGGQKTIYAWPREGEDVMFKTSQYHVQDLPSPETHIFRVTDNSNGDEFTVIYIPLPLYGGDGYTTCIDNEGHNCIEARVPNVEVCFHIKSALTHYHLSLIHI